MRTFRVIISYAVVSILFFCVPFFLGAEQKNDLNAQFVERFYRLKSGDADANLKVNRLSPGTKVDSIKKQDTASNGGGLTKKESEGFSPSSIGKLLQLTLVILLAAIVFILSRRSKKRNRY